MHYLVQNATKSSRGLASKPFNPLDVAMSEYKHVTWRGFEEVISWRPPRSGDDFTSPAEFEELRQETREREDRIEWAAWWLFLNLEPIKTTYGSYLRSSYKIKHLAEREAPWGYIGSGEIILAAAMLGWPIRRTNWRPNAHLGVSVKSVKATQARLRGVGRDVYMPRPAEHLVQANRRLVARRRVES